jgi:hypothetical protein
LTLYISYNRNGVWTKPTNLGNKINSEGNEYSPAISPDGKYFFGQAPEALRISRRSSDWIIRS